MQYVDNIGSDGLVDRSPDCRSMGRWFDSTYYRALPDLGVFTLIFKKWFLSGLDQETVIGQQLSCVISETNSIKRDAHVRQTRPAKSIGEVERSKEGRIAQHKRPDVRQRTRLSNPRVRCEEVEVSTKEVSRKT